MADDFSTAGGSPMAQYCNSYGRTRFDNPLYRGGVLGAGIAAGGWNVASGMSWEVLRRQVGSYPNSGRNLCGVISLSDQAFRNLPR